MADDSDNEIAGEKVENQPYDELLEVPDGEEVASIYTPTPRNPKNTSYQYTLNTQNTATKPASNKKSLDSPRDDIPQRRTKTMSENSESSQADTPKGDEPQVGSQGRRTSTGDDSAGNRDGAINHSNTMGGAVNRVQRDAETGDSESDANESVEDQSQDQLHELQGGYDPTAFRDLPVSPEIKDIFKFIERYQPQAIELEFKLKPFIPEYIPCIGDIDAFIKIPRPDGKPDTFGLTVLDEPSAKQSDQHVLDLQLRTLSKQTSSNKTSNVKSVESGNSKAIDIWIKNISELQKNKPVQIVNYQKPMPDIESLMQAWTPEFEDVLKEVSLPSADLNVDLATYVDIICALMDVPVYKSKVQALHVLFTLYSEFKNSGHFNTLTDKNQQNGASGGNAKDGADRLIIE